MSKLTGETKQRLRYGFRHPVKWMRGDGLNDPVIGAYMDHRNDRSQVNRWVMRTQSVVIGIPMSFSW